MMLPCWTRYLIKLKVSSLRGAQRRINPVTLAGLRKDGTFKFCAVQRGFVHSLIFVGLVTLLSNRPLDNVCLHHIE